MKNKENRKIDKTSKILYGVKPGIYKHSKTGNLYKVHFVAKHSETLEDLVVYEALYDNDKSKFWVRPLPMFEGLINIDNKQVPRFEFISNELIK